MSKAFADNLVVAGGGLPQQDVHHDPVTSCMQRTSSRVFSPARKMLSSGSAIVVLQGVYVTSGHRMMHARLQGQQKHACL